MSRRRVMMLLLSLPAYVRSFIERVSLDGGTLDNRVGLEDVDEEASLTMLPNAYKDGTLYSVLPESGAGDFDVVRGSAATRVNAEGLIEDVATNIPRIDYTDGTPSLLLEPQSTNLITQSEIFTSWSDYQATSNTTTSPSGNSVLFLDFEDVRMFPTTAILNGTEYTSSIYLKANKVADVRVRDAAGNDQLVSLTTEWVRYESTATAASSHTLLIDARFSQGLGASGLEIALWGAQIEALPYATSYIPTSGAIATRLADSVTGAGDATTFNSTEGVLYFEGSALAGSNSKTFGISDGTGSNRVLISLSNGGVRGFIASNSAIAFDQTFAGASALDNNKIAVKYKLNDFSVWVNGTEVLTDTTGGTPISLSELAFDNGSGSAQFQGKVKDVRTYNTALTDAELQTLTTI